MLKEGQVRIPSGCAISGIIDTSGLLFSGQDIINSIALMRERSNGLGGGFAAYGIYPELADKYALHVMFLDKYAQNSTEEVLRRFVDIRLSEPIPTRKHPGVTDIPFLWRYFVSPLKTDIDPDDTIYSLIMKVNESIDGAYIFSSGKNMGVFKGVGYPEDLGEFYRLEEYSGHTWLAHGRFPTNTPGWWGGAHPFALLDISVVHNGEVSSYGANRRYLESYGYHFGLKTDTEVIAYALHLLQRRHHLPWELAASVLAPKTWEQIERLPEEEQELYAALRLVYGHLAMSGPFSILVGFDGGLLALNDRLKLRPMVVGRKGTRYYIASEEAAIRCIQPELDELFYPRSSHPVLIRVGDNESVQGIQEGKSA
ncbi:MAG: glutamine amidotransferase family protein [Firmicutes bacterium]|nr:glutamine amidotransferase family protein [Bacillota bacterium]